MSTTPKMSTTMMPHHVSMTFIIPIACLIIALTSNHNHNHFAHAQHTGSGDPRCPADFDPLKSCPSSMILPGGAGLNPTRNSDPTTCNDQENCPRCLGDDVWQQKLKDEIGLYAAMRDPDFKPWVMVNSWLSHAITSTITMILLRDAMNISARGAAKYIDGTVDYICCKDFSVNMEQWESGTFLDDATEFTVTSAPIGYQGQGAFFVPPYTAEKFPLSTTYQAYKYLDDYKTIFPPSFSTDCTNMTVSSAGGCTAGNYVCETNAWTNTSCYDDKWYVPPQCNVPGEVGSPNTTKCQEIWHADPTYDGGFFEGMIRNNNLNMTASYLGVTRHNAMVREAVSREQDIMFYWYEPDPLIAQVKARVVNFDPDTLECASQRRSDPTLSTAKCGYPVMTLQKRTRKENLALNNDFKFFFDSFALTRGQIDALLATHTSGGGNATVYDLSCSWIKNNFDTWRVFVKNTPSSAQITTVTTDSSSILSNPGVLAALIVVPLLLVAVIVAVIVWLACRHRASTKNAPKTAPLALAFTDIESSTMLWEACGDDMGLAVEIHHAIIRKHIEEFGAYEVKTIGDSFMIACSSLGDATLMCLAIQTSLGECETFCPALRFQKTEELDFHYPLRIRIGLHWCLEVNPTIDRMHGRYDYYGQDVNVCARVEAQGSGGQIMVTADTMAAIMETEVYPLVIAPDIVSALVKKNVELKGVSECVTLYAMAPTSQVESGYVRANLVEGLPVIGEASGDMLEVKNLSSNNSNASIQSDGMSMRGYDDSRSIAASNQGGAAPTFFGTTGGRRSGNTIISAEQHLALEFSSALFRIAFKAVPEAGKSAWLKTLAKQMKVPLTAAAPSTTSAPRATATASDKHAKRMEHFKHFELLQTAADETYTKAHASQFPDSAIPPPSFDPPTAHSNIIIVPKSGAGMSATSQDPLDMILGESFH